MRIRLSLAPLDSMSDNRDKMRRDLSPDPPMNVDPRNIPLILIPLFSSTSLEKHKSLKERRRGGEKEGDPIDSSANKSVSPRWGDLFDHAVAGFQSVAIGPGVIDGRCNSRERQKRWGGVPTSWIRDRWREMEDWTNLEIGWDTFS